jgi:hypothetical protein
VGAAGAIRRDPKYAVRVEMGHMALMLVILTGHIAPAVPRVADFLKLNNSLVMFPAGAARAKFPLS